MGVKWTDQQQQVIDLRDRNLLVSAAAGSELSAPLSAAQATKLITIKMLKSNAVVFLIFIPFQS